jgi:hypothetical protein
VAVRRQRLSAGQVDNRHIRLITLEEWTCHEALRARMRDVLNASEFHSRNLLQAGTIVPATVGGAGAPWSA